jgi:hypothetical protein
LSQNYPNPFNPTTVIRYQTSEVSHVTLKVYDIMGRIVETLVNGIMNVGEHRITWSAEGFPRGVYFYRLQVGNFTEMKKLTLVN